MIVDLPFAPSRSSTSWAAWVDERRIVVAEKVESGFGEPSFGQVKARALVLDVETGKASLLGGEAETLAVPGSQVHFATAGGRFLVFGAPTGPSGPDTVSGLSIDVTSGQATTIAAAGAAPSATWLTSSTLTASSGALLFYWPSSEHVVDLDAGYSLDVEKGTWQRVRTGLGRRASAQAVELSEGRVAVWGGFSWPGLVPFTTGAWRDPATGAWQSFRHPAVGGGWSATDGTRILNLNVAAAGPRSESRLTGHVFDAVSGPLFPIDLRLSASFRNIAVLHLGGGYAGYLGEDVLHLWHATSGAYREVALPFVPNLPSTISVHALARGRWLFEGTNSGLFAFEPATGVFCSLPQFEQPPHLLAASHGLYSKKYLVVIGGSAAASTEAGCPQGDCPREPGTERPDPRAQIFRFSQ